MGKKDKAYSLKPVGELFDKLQLLLRLDGLVLF
ncbi:hypothetical protein ACVIGB_008428 [Bradyrhizobium sp. USDA 4341]